jgi:hypothetical protein
MSRRDQVAMTEDELRTYLAERRVVTCASMGPNGRPHLAPLWYVPDGLVISGWTYAKSQKARNLERLPQATLQIEDGERYDELRGVSLECDVEVIRDPAEIAAIGLALMIRYELPGTKPADVPAEVREIVDRQATKRVGLVFRPTHVASWDHRKLGGVY